VPRVRLTLLALLLLAVPAQAVILRLVSMQEVLDGEQLIFVAAVDSVLPERPAVVLKLDEKIKGDPPFDRLPVNMTGDEEAKKGEHTKLMLDRLDPGRKVVVFASKKGKRYNAMAFTDGTWFSLQGVIDDDGKTVRWAFLHGEPYLRRTFKGTTAEMRQICIDGLAKKAAPPAPNEKEPPGFGPAVGKGGGGRARHDGSRVTMRVRRRSVLPPPSPLPPPPCLRSCPPSPSSARSRSSRRCSPGSRRRWRWR
jgi:hypothetical protein